MSVHRFATRRFWLLATCAGLLSAGSLLPGCGSDEVQFKPMESAKRDDVDKSINNPIDNPYGAAIKVQPKVKTKPGAGKTTRD